MFANGYIARLRQRDRKKPSSDSLATRRRSRGQKHLRLEGLELRCLLSGNAAIAEFPVPPPTSEPYGITAGPDGNLWFTEGTSSQIGRITPTGQVTEFSAGITPDGSPTGITAGPDGNLWFTEEDPSQVGRITPTGQVTEFAAGITPGSDPYGITAGPDGILWFAEEGNGIGRITPSGHVTEFTVGITPGGEPRAITVGPDGNLWFTEFGGRIGRITPTGQVTEFSTGIPLNSFPDSITAGPDGNLWFTELAGRIGRITPTGQITEFSAGITPFGPKGITAGPDGNLWFASIQDQVGRITPTGQVTEFSAGITPGSYPIGITAGHDGNLWFTESGDGKIGRLDMPLTAAGTVLIASEAVPFSGVVATFTDPNPLAQPGDFTTTITWGDGTTTAGQVTEDAAGTFYVTGGHTYAQYQFGTAINVTIVDRDGNTTTVSVPPSTCRVCPFLRSWPSLSPRCPRHPRGRR